MEKLFEWVNSFREEINLLYADNKSDILILLAYLEDKKIINFDDYKEYFERQKDELSESIEKELREIVKGVKNDK